jgi:hypothetical protein
MSIKTPDGETKEDICKIFNSLIRKLANKAYVMSKRSINAESLKNQLKILLDDDPSTNAIIVEAGPEIYQHRELIEKKDKNFWDKVDFQKKYGHTKNMQTYSELFNIIKTKWPTLEKDEIDEIGNIASSILNAYKTYRVFVKIEDGSIKAEQVGFTTSKISKKK